MDKKKYLVKTLSRTNRKDFENYVVNRIYSLLNDLDIKPMTQKYVKRGRHYYLIDLYFPQFNIGVECDEAHHLARTKNDVLRYQEIVSDNASYEELRIDVAAKSLEEINARVDEIVEIIRRKKSEAQNKGTFAKWQIVSPREFVRRNDSLSVDDEVVFSTNREVCELVLGMNYKKGARICFNQIKTLEYDKWYCWFPNLIVERSDYKSRKVNGWNNTISEDGREIYEYNENGRKRVPPADAKRIVFSRSRDPLTGLFEIKFIGVFKEKGRETESKYTLITYEKIADSVQIVRTSRR